MMDRSGLGADVNGENKNLLSLILSMTLHLDVEEADGGDGDNHLDKEEDEGQQHR
jgi:hypothetical protein